MSKVSIKVSADTFDEIAQALGKQNIQLKNDTEITLTKDIALERPYNMLHVNIRKDAISEAVKVNPDNVISLANEIFKFIMEGKVEEVKISTETVPHKAWGK